MKIGIISDTHGIIKYRALEELKGSQFIIHAGDIGNEEVLDTLNSIAPVYAVKGNVDKGIWAENIPEERYITIEGVNIYLIHDINNVAFDPKSKGIHIIISGHSHQFSNLIKDNIVYLNPGGAGRKRFNLPLTVASLYIENGINRIHTIYI